MWLLNRPWLLTLPLSCLSTNTANAENNQWEHVCFGTRHNPIISQDKLQCWVTAGQGAELHTGFILPDVVNPEQ